MNFMNKLKENKKFRNTVISVTSVVVALAIILSSVLFITNRNKNKINADNKSSESAQNESLSNERPSESESVTDVSGDTVTEDATADKTDGSSEPTNAPVSNSQAETGTKKNNSSGNGEAPTKKNNSTGSSNKTTTTTQLAVNVCKHNWKLVSYTNGCYVYHCSKCDDYKTDEREMNPNDFMGNKSEYLELLALVNKARREAGLKELIYIDEFQKGTDIRARELTQKFSHTRPNGTDGNTAYEYSPLLRDVYGPCGENIVGSSVETPQQAFNAWMHSSGHKKTILDDMAIGFTASRCDGYWVMQTYYDFTPYK